MNTMNTYTCSRCWKTMDTAGPAHQCRKEGAAEKAVGVAGGLYWGGITLWMLTLIVLAVVGLVFGVA